MQPQYRLLPYEDLRLHTAALNGNLADVKQLLHQGLNVQGRDIFFSTPLHLAAFNGHADVVALLIEAGAKVDSESYKNITPLFLAVKNNHLGVISLLMTHGADPNHKMVEDNSPYSWMINRFFFDMGAALDTVFKSENRLNLLNDIEIFRILANPETGKPIINNAFGEATIPTSVVMTILSRFTSDPEIREKTNEVIAEITIPSLHNLFIDTKNLLHTFPFGKEYHLTVPNIGKLDIKSEGHSQYLTTQLARDSLESFIGDMPGPAGLIKHTMFSGILNVLESAERLVDEKLLPHTASRVLEYIKTGEMVLLPTGWEGHAITVLFYQDYMIVCNSGDRYNLKPSGAIIYKISHPENINEDLIFNILNNEYQMEMEYDLHYTLGLNAVHLIEFPDQVFGNCAWYSFLPAIESMLFLKLSEVGMDVGHARIMAHDYFEEWHDFHKAWTLDNYLQHHAEDSFELLMDLFVREAISVDSKSNLRANMLLDVLSEPPFEENLAEFVVNQPISWLRLDDVLQDAGINLQTGRKGNIDIPQLTDYNEPNVDNRLAEPLSLMFVSPLSSLEESLVLPIEF